MKISLLFHPVHIAPGRPRHVAGRSRAIIRHTRSGASPSAERRRNRNQRVEPQTNNKLLFRGRIWVDAEDFAVVRIEAVPAKNPSFWTK